MALHRGLAHLQAAEFLYETRLFPELEYTFKHALTHEVAYGSLLLERRRGCTRASSRSANARPSGGPSRSNAYTACPAGRGVGQGCDLLPAGWRQGLRPRPRVREAVAAFEQALQALAHLPEDGDTRRLASISVRVERC